MAVGGVNSLFFTDPNSETKIEYFSRVSDDKHYGIGGDGVFVGNILQGGKTYYYMPDKIVYSPGLAIMYGKVLVNSVWNIIETTLELIQGVAYGSFKVYYSMTPNTVIDQQPKLGWETPASHEHLVIKKPT